MPYIAETLRPKLNKHVEDLAEVLIAEAGGSVVDAAGPLNYVITRLILQVIPPTKYWRFPLIKGILADVRDEIQDRLQRPFEDVKKSLNGDLEEFE